MALVVGAPVFRYYPYVPGSYLPDGMRLLHISDDAAETARAPVGDSLLGDAVLYQRHWRLTQGVFANSHCRDSLRIGDDLGRF